MMRRHSRGLRSPRAGTPARAIVAWLVVIGGGLLAGVLLGPATPQATAGEAAIDRGGALFQRYCAVCHANDGSGVDGVAPALDAFSAARIDLTMRTGRMPLADPMRGVRQRTLTDEEREAVMAYVTELIDVEDELPDPPRGEAVEGREIYALHCAQCHGATGSGGVAGDGVEIPPIVGLDPVTVAAATREGPFQMPRFGEEIVSDQEIGDIAAFLDEETRQPTSPLGLTEVSKFEAVGFAAVLTIAVVLVCAWAGGMRRRQDREEHV